MVQSTLLERHERQGMGVEMVSQAHVRSRHGIRWGKRRSERIALGLPVDPERRAGRNMHKIERRHRVAQIFCMEHNVLLGVLTDTALVTRTADKPYPHTSGSVATPCQQCANERQIVWFVDIRKLRALMATSDRLRPRPVDVREVVPDAQMDILREYGLLS